MESYKVVRPEHLNHFGYLFGGFLLKWVDEISWIATMDKVEFRRGVHQGTVLRFDARESRPGNTSVEYEVQVFADDLETGAEEAIFQTHIRFVCLDAQGQKMPLPRG